MAEVCVSRSRKEEEIRPERNRSLAAAAPGAALIYIHKKSHPFNGTAKPWEEEREDVCKYF